MRDAVSQLKQIAAQVRRLPESLDFESRLNVETVAGDLVLEAIKLGAFSGPEYAELQNLIRRQLVLPSGDYKRQILLETFAFLYPDFCDEPLRIFGLVADAIEAEATKLKAAAKAPADAAVIRHSRRAARVGPTTERRIMARLPTSAEVTFVYHAAKNLAESLYMLQQLLELPEVPPNAIRVKTFESFNLGLPSLVAALYTALPAVTDELTVTAAQNNQGMVCACGEAGANAHELISHIGNETAFGLFCAAKSGVAASNYQDVRQFLPNLDRDELRRLIALAEQESILTRKRIENAGSADSANAPVAKTEKGEGNGGATAAAPVALLTPAKLLASWGEILGALGLKKHDREKVARLNRTRGGPIKPGQKGQQPIVDCVKLLEWWNRLTIEYEVGENRKRDAKPTTAASYKHGRDGVAIPDIGGSERKRRADRKP
jgi:hypothetical protein